MVFLETALGLGSHKHHAYVEAIPVPQSRSSRAPGMFRKAIDEAESEWSTHASKRCIDTRAKGLRGSIPANFPYFHVEFGLAAGFVHVVDDEAKFPRTLGRDVLVGLLDLPPEEMHRRQRPMRPEEQARAVAAFSKKWEPHDWTRALD